jgi:hypothetical protein
MENNGCFDGAQGKHRKQMREIDADDAFQEVGPHVENPPKFLWNKPFHRNVVGIDAQFFVPKGHIGIFPIGFKSYEIPPFFLCSKGGLRISDGSELGG